MDIEYYYCLVCSMRLPVTRRLQGTHEECEEFYRPTKKVNISRDETATRREQVAYLIASRMSLKRIAMKLNIPYSTIRNDARYLREARTA